MRCPKCKYFFSEELRRCPKCGEEVRLEMEKIGVFPTSSQDPFLKIEDFLEKEEDKEERNKAEERLIEFPFSTQFF